jgi:uncharacterized protein YdeI (YjbR/CyaY-like superfamily)
VAAEQPVLSFESAEAFDAWLSEHHADSDGIWIRFAKKASGIPSVVYAEALDSALCHGWIDGQAKSLDDDHYMQRFTPRRKRSPWSKRNVGKALALIEAGRMTAAGHAEIERAKADGRWERAYEGQRNATVPDDLQAELDKDPQAAEFFASLSSTNRYAILYRLQEAKKPETRARRLEKFVAMLKAGETLHP